MISNFRGVMILVLGLSYASGFGLDTYYVSVTFDPGATWDVGLIAPSNLTAFNNAVVSTIQTTIVTASPSVSNATHAEVIYDDPTSIVLHVVVTAVSGPPSYQVYQLLSRWGTAEGFGPLNTIWAYAFTYLHQSALTFALANITIPCRSADLNPSIISTPSPPTVTTVCSSPSSPPYRLPSKMTFLIGTSAPLTGGASFISTTLCSGMGLTATCANNVLVSGINTPANPSVTSASFRTSPAQYFTSVLLQNVSTASSVFVNFVAAVRSGATAYQALSIVSISTVYGDETAVVYSTTENFNPFAPAAQMTCDPIIYYWSLLLIVVLPLAYIVGRQFYHSGKKSGAHQEAKRLSSDVSGGGAALEPQANNTLPPAAGRDYPEQRSNVST